MWVVASDVTDLALVALGLHGARTIEIGLADLSGAHQEFSKGVGVIADLGVHHRATLKPHDPLVVPEIRGDAENTRLPIEIE
jgi:hypothetical protein